MVFNTFIKCQVCGCITRVRLQVGGQEEHPIEVTCGKCGTSLSGKVKIGQDCPGLNFSFDNADDAQDENADYVVECSGEFPTAKQAEVADLEGLVVTPFIRYMNCMKTDDSYEEFVQAVSQLNATAKKWKNYKRILTLAKNNSEYLTQEIQKEFSGQFFQCRDESETLRAVHMIEVHGLYSALRKDILKGVMGCTNRHVEEETLVKAYLMAWNALVENREDLMEQWTEQLQSENLLEGYRAEKFIEYTDGAEPLTKMDTDFMLKTLDHIKVFEDGTLLVVFLDGTEIECKNEEE